MVNTGRRWRVKVNVVITVVVLTAVAGVLNVMMYVSEKIRTLRERLKRRVDAE